MAVSIDGNGEVLGITGNVIQVVSKHSPTPWAITQSSNTWRPYPGDELLITITPRSSSSKFLLLASITMGTDSNAVAFRFTRENTAIGVGQIVGTRISGTSRIHYLNSDGNHRLGTMGGVHLDSPATIDPIEYNVDLMHEGGNLYVNRNQTYTDNTPVYSGIFSSSLTVMEISA